MGGLTLVVGVPAVVWLAVIGAALWVASRVSRRATWLVTGFGAAIVVALVFQLHLSCAAAPVYVPPSEADAALGSDGAMIHACDGPEGVVVHLLQWVAAPVALMGQALMTWWLIPKE